MNRWTTLPLLNYLGTCKKQLFRTAHIFFFIFFFFFNIFYFILFYFILFYFIFFYFIFFLEEQLDT